MYGMSRIALCFCALLMVSCTNSAHTSKTTVPPEDSTSQSTATAKASSTATTTAITTIKDTTTERNIVDYSQHDIGTDFVKLALALGQHDLDYVDAYHGPQKWRETAASENKTLAEIASDAQGFVQRIQATRIGDPEVAQRYAFLLKQFQSLQTKANILLGNKLSFDEESHALYDAVSPHHDARHYQQILDRLEQALPGSGSLNERVQAIRNEFMIPPERVDEVFREAIRECRERTQKYIELPANESFEIEYVTDKSWSGYNWFQGNAKSLIQVNLDFPIKIDRAIDLACHEGYPGHHVYNSLLEAHLLKGKGWQEFSVFPLFSPTALLAEGSANYGIEMAFPGDERYQYEEEVLFKLAGLDATRVREFYQIEGMLEQLKYASNDTARRYLDGQIDAETAAQELELYSLSSPDRAKQRIAFFDKYRSYVINYNLGQDMVAAWVEKDLDASDQKARWKKFERLLTQPILPSELVSD